LGESLQNYIQCFSRKFYELPRVGDADVISVFWSSTMCHTLVDEHGRD
jgi:hypothetical protein